MEIWWNTLKTERDLTSYILGMSTKSTGRIERQAKPREALVAGFGTLRIDPSLQLREFRMELSQRNVTRSKQQRKTRSPKSISR